jgi:hypothetical protein
MARADKKAFSCSVRVDPTESCTVDATSRLGNAAEATVAAIEPLKNARRFNPFFSFPDFKSISLILSHGSFIEVAHGAGHRIPVRGMGLVEQAVRGKRTGKGCHFEEGATIVQSHA